MFRPAAKGPQSRLRFLGTAMIVLALASPLPLCAADGVPLDLSGYSPDCGVSIQASDLGASKQLRVDWPFGSGETGRLVLALKPGVPLIDGLFITKDNAKQSVALLKGVDPVLFVTVGTRESPPDRPPSMSVFNVFFDSPAQRPHRSYRSLLELKRVRVVSQGHRASIILDELNVGPFVGSLQITVYRGSPLVQIDGVVTTREERRAFLYDAGLASSSPSWENMAWSDTEGRLERQAVGLDGTNRARMVRHRTIVAETEAGSVACFPSPHQFFFARDTTDNLGYAWSGRGHRDLDDRYGFGVRQAEEGGGNYSPWYNAPPGTEQRLGVFYLLSRGTAEDALRETLRYTHGDRFRDLPGHRTFTSHWHMEIAMAAIQEKAAGKGRTIPDFTRVFKELGVNIVHLAEFHGPGHAQDPGPLRLPEMDAMFDECRRLSDGDLLFLPGEEANVHLGARITGGHPGHWVYLFPRPVSWTMRRGPGEPFSEEIPGRGTVYHVGSQDDMIRLLRQEHGLAWTAHPRIKASNWAPDIYRREDFYRDRLWLGAAWKGMPVDLSRPRLGERALDLLDDMANWGGPKYLLGEVDVFKIDHTHELYGHMNVNYLRLERTPRFEDGWEPVLDALRHGRFFVTTGEVLIREFRVGGKESGQTLETTRTDRPGLTLDLEWTFPMRFAEVISGDGERVYREKVDLAETEAFGRRTLTLNPGLKGRRWVRAEAWDIAGNGAFTQPVWLQDNSNPR